MNEIFRNSVEEDINGRILLSCSSVRQILDIFSLGIVLLSIIFSIMETILFWICDELIFERSRVSLFGSFKKLLIVVSRLLFALTFCRV